MCPIRRSRAACARGSNSTEADAHAGATCHCSERTDSTRGFSSHLPAVGTAMSSTAKRSARCGCNAASSSFESAVEPRKTHSVHIAYAEGGATHARPCAVVGMRGIASASRRAGSRSAHALLCRHHGPISAGRSTRRRPKPTPPSGTQRCVRLTNAACGLNSRRQEPPPAHLAAAAMRLAAARGAAQVAVGRAVACRGAVGSLGVEDSPEGPQEALARACEEAHAHRAVAACPAAHKIAAAAYQVVPCLAVA